MNFKTLIGGLCLGGLMAGPAVAKVSPEEAKQLGGPKLTAFGAQQAANADGSIPAYTGPLKISMPGVGSTTLMLPDPYSSDKMLYKVDASNMSQYASLLTPGIAAMLRKYPTFHLDVYATHRSAGYPQWALDQTMKNATTAELTGSIEGDGVTGAYGGVPFPIPKNAYEVLWDFYLAWEGPAAEAVNGGGYFVDSSGNPTLTNRTSAITNYLFNDPSRTSMSGPFYYETLGTTTAPASSDGQKVMRQLPINYNVRDDTTYTYTVGQRRVRLAPEFKYDTPIAANGGSFTFDEISIFSGRPDRFQFRLVGEKEMLIPYNDFAFLQPDASVAKFLTPRHPNPEMIRWEKHRVWVLEATLKPGERHIYSRRTFYIDEDTYFMMASDAYDQAGNLYRVAFGMEWPCYNAPYPASYTAQLFFNLNRQSYAVSQWYGGPNQGGEFFKSKPYNQQFYTPESMAGMGIR